MDKGFLLFENTVFSRIIQSTWFLNWIYVIVWSWSWWQILFNWLKSWIVCLINFCVLFFIFFEFIKRDVGVFVGGWYVIWNVCSFLYKRDYFIFDCVIAGWFFKTISFLPYFRCITLWRWSVCFFCLSYHCIRKSYFFWFLEFTIVFGKWFGPINC